MLGGCGGQMGLDPLDVGVAAQDAASPVEVVDLIVFIPVGRPDRRVWQALNDARDAVQDQIDLRLETGGRPFPPFATDRHGRASLPDID